MELQDIDGISAELFSNPVRVVEDVIVWKNVLVLVLGQRRPLIVFRRNLGRGEKALASVFRDCLPQQAIALAVAVRPRAIEKITAEIDREL